MSQWWIDPALGRFINRDPIGYAGGLNMFSYADANPVNQVDPTGLVGGGSGFAEDSMMRFNTAPASYFGSGAASAAWRRWGAGLMFSIGVHLKIAEYISYIVGGVQVALGLLEITGGLAVAVTPGGILVAPGATLTGLATVASGLTIMGLGKLTGDNGNNMLSACDDWASTPSNTPQQALDRHFAKYGRELGAKSKEEYTQAAVEFLERFGDEGYLIDLFEKGGSPWGKGIKVVEDKLFGIYQQSTSKVVSFGRANGARIRKAQASFRRLLPGG